MKSLFRDLPRRVRIVEVGPRDGLQNQPARIPVEIKADSSDITIDFEGRGKAVSGLPKKPGGGSSGGIFPGSTL